MASPKSTFLVYDLIARVMELCQHEYGLLFQCSLVNWEFNRAASRMLYSRVVMCPKFSAILDLRETNGVPGSSNFTSAALPRNAHYVVSLEIKGYISPRPPPRNTLSRTLTSVLPLFINLRRVRFTPATFHEDLFTPVLPLLTELQNRPSISLTDVTVNQSCFTRKSNEMAEEQDDRGTAPLLVQLCGLRRLTLINPGRAILQLLPDWLGRLKGTLVELHLKDNCGSVTPGVLKSFIPHLKDHLLSFTLGLSYSLTDGDVFTFLGSLPHLRRVHLRYYWQIKPPPRQPPLSSLRCFVATHPRLGSSKEVRNFDKWLLRAIAASPALEVLHLRREGEGDGDEDVSEAESDKDRPLSHMLSHSGLIDHVIKKHAKRIRVLDLGEAFVSVRQLREVMARCAQLEELKIAVDKSALMVFAENKAALSHLTSISLRIANGGPKFQADEQLISKILSLDHPKLRHAEIHGIKWEVLWSVEVVAEFPARFKVQRVDSLKKKSAEPEGRS